MTTRALSLSIFLLLLFFISCGGEKNPKGVVKDFIWAVQDSDSATIVSCLDLDTIVRRSLKTTSPEDSLLLLGIYKEKFLGTLLGDGHRRITWLKSQIVLGAEEIRDSLAEVEVSFIDKETGRQNYTKMQLRETEEGWKIIYFY
ncbi:MAG: hypothetical protein E3J45_02125 [Candidatus Zixiibacteriota bacterium]|nr:MAG: hypothetical protein E3J45_02125 [candidate division Zixibacteria bacterium]